MSCGEYLKTKLGKFRAISIGVGFFAVVFGGAGHDQQGLIHWSGGLLWAPKLALSIIIITWLFSIIMLVCAVTPLAGHFYVIMADPYGHVSLGVALLLGLLLICYYIYDGTAGLCEYLQIGDCLDWSFMKAKNILWVLAGIFSIVQAVYCILIYMMLKSAQGQIAPMRFNHAGSQAPPGSYPSQEGSQQQAPPPEQQPSGHHSKHSHKV